MRVLTLTPPAIVVWRSMNEEIAEYRMGRVIQRIVELETYRLMALLSLPKVKHHSEALDEIEAELRLATTSLAKAHQQLDSPNNLKMQKPY